VPSLKKRRTVASWEGGTLKLRGEEGKMEREKAGKQGE